jgi:putrescine transport system ATP-binding protein
LVQLENLGGRKPHELSGGQRQRVALARSLAKRPKVLLLDEPMAALDKKLREETQFELKALQAKLGLTFIIVTHDQEEAMTVADRIGVMNQGQLVQVATPAVMYEQPNSRWVASFIGDVNLLEARATLDRHRLDSPLGSVRVVPAIETAPGTTLWLALRPEKLRIDMKEPEAVENSVAGTVHEIGYFGDFSIYKVRLESGLILKASATNRARTVERPIGVDDRVWLSWASEAAVVLPR